MDLLQASGGPFMADYGKDATLSIPRFDMDDIIALGTKILNERTAAQTNGMDENQIAQFKTYYPPLPPDMQEIKRFVRTPQGQQYVVRTCLAKATLFQKDNSPSRAMSVEEIDRVVRQPSGVLGPLAWELASLEEKPLVAAKPDPDDKEKTQQGK